MGALPPTRRRPVGLTTARPGGAGRWRLERWTGRASDAHGRPWPPEPGPSLRLVDVERTAVVLGSTQSWDVVDRAGAAAAGVDVVRRRSGGGAVLVRPGGLVWLDAFVSRHDRLWTADVGRAFHWLGAAWAAALASLGLDAEWHAGPLVRAPWSDLVCFAGRGPGEVAVGGAKVVGMSQRRTREGALFQCAALLAWEPAALVDLLVLEPGRRAAAVRELGGVAAGVGVTAGELEEAIAGQVARW